MATWLAQIDFNDGSGYRDVTDLVDFSSFKLNQTLWSSDLAPTIDTCSFSLYYDSTILTLLLTTSGYIKINVQKDAADYFTGFVRQNFNATMRSRFETITVQCVDPGIRLQQTTINPSTPALWESYYVCDPAHKSSSIVHQLLYDAGVDDADIDAPSITQQVDFYANRIESVTYFERIAKLMVEFGYVFRHNESGTFVGTTFKPGSITTTDTFDNEHIIGELDVEKGEEKYEGVKVNWESHETLTGVTIFSDTTGGDATYKMNVTVASGGYYPDGAGTNDTYADYMVSGRKLIGAKNVSLDAVLGPGVSSTVFTDQYTRALVQFENTGGSASYIRKFDISGDAVVAKSINQNQHLHVSGTKKILTYTSAYVQSSSDANVLAVALDNFYEYGDFIYKLTSREDFATGGFVYVKEDAAFSINNLCVIIDKTTDERSGKIAYQCQGIAAYSADTTSDTQYQQAEPPSSQSQNTETAVSLLPQTVAIRSTPPSYSGLTNTPTVPDLRAQGKYMGVILTVDWQQDLRAFERFEFQASDDAGTTAYALSDNMTTGLGALGGVTEWPGVLYIHTLPTSATTLSYRARRVNLVSGADNNSAWSSWITVTTLTSSDGDLVAQALFANVVYTNVLNTMVANISSRLVISSSSGYTAYNLAGSSPALGDTRVYMDTDEISIDVCTALGSPNDVAHATWSGMVKLGGRGTWLLPYLRAQGVAAKTLVTSNVEKVGLPDAGALNYHFDSDFADQNGTDPWTKVNVNIDLFPNGKFGTSEVQTTSTGSDAYFYYSSFWATGDDLTISAWIKASALPPSDGLDFIFMKGGGAGGYPNTLKLWVNADGSIHVACFGYGPSSNTGGTLGAEMAPAGTVAEGSYYFIALTWDESASLMTLLVNADEYALDLSADPPVWTAENLNLYFGLHQGTDTTDQFLIDELTLVEGVAVSTTELVKQYTRNVAIDATWDITEDDLLLIPGGTSGRIMMDMLDGSGPTEMFYSDSNSNGSWRKLPDGTLEQTCVASVSFSSQSNKLVTVTLPYTDIGTNYAVGAAVSDYGTGTMGNWIIGASVSSKTTTTFALRLADVNATTYTGSFTIRVPVRGRWKA